MIGQSWQYWHLIGQTGHKLSILKGEMVGISGDLWEFTEDLTSISWDSVGSVAEVNGSFSLVETYFKGI